jgi:uncharacterized protein YpmB
MKNKEKRLFTEMIIFLFIIILCFGLIVINYKSGEIKLKKVEEKINDYIKDNYSDIEDDIKKEKIKQDNNSYSIKIYNKNNKNLLFYVKYKDKKITSTYDKDYLEGNSLTTYYNKKINKDLKNKNTNSSFSNLTISYDVKLNDCTDLIYKRLIDNKYNLPIYTINDEDTISFDALSINKRILLTSKYVNSIGFTPKYYSLTYTDSNNLVNTMNIKFKSDILDISTLDIGSAIVNNNKSILEKYSIEVKYLN